MSSEDKGVYISISTHLKGEFYDAFLVAVEREAKAWINSDEGKKFMKDAVVDTVKKTIDRYGYGFSDNPHFKKFQAVVADRLARDLLGTVGVAPEVVDLEEAAKVAQKAADEAVQQAAGLSRRAEEARQARRKA